MKFWNVVWAVVLGLWLFAISSGLAWLGVVHILRATGDIR
jgi:hypothetical protein